MNVAFRLLTISMLLSTFTGRHALAQITLLQDEHGLECKPLKMTAEIQKVLLDRRDRNLQLVFKEHKISYEDIKFLDSAVLMKNTQKNEDILLIQILENGEPILLRGKSYAYKESDCKDTGASKTCLSANGDKLFWSAEKIKLGESKEFPVVHYGHFPNEGTYSLAGSLQKNQSQAIQIIDYGAQFQVLQGELLRLSCSYQK